MEYIIDSEKERDIASNVVKCLAIADDWVVRISPYTKQRSNPQNRLYWAWVRILSRHFGYTDEDLHEILKAEFLGLKEIEYNGKKMMIPKSSKTLSKAVKRTG